MPPKQSNNNKKSKNAKPPASKPKRANRQGASDDYLRLLSDPCNASIVHAPYGGVGSAYTIRTVDIIKPSVTATATPGVVPMDFVFEISPWNTPALAYGAVSATGYNGTLGVIESANFITNGSVVKSYRPIAACVKWVPTGAIATRQGVIGLSYSPGRTIPNSGTLDVATFIRNSQYTATNGAVKHEAVWLPSFMDQRMSTNSESNVAGVGSLLVVGSQIDGTAAGTGSVPLTSNGYIEVTVVWEWEPYLYGTGAVASLAPHNDVTLDSVLSRIKNVGNFIYQHSGTVAAAYSYATGSQGRRPMSLMM